MLIKIKVRLHGHFVTRLPSTLSRPSANVCISGHVTKRAITPFDPP